MGKGKFREYKKILVGYDGKASSKQALKRALHMAKCMKTEITLLKVLHEEVEIPKPLTPEEFEEVKKIHTDKMKKEVSRMAKGEKMIKKINYDIGIGDPPEVILRYAEENDFDLIVIGRRNVGRFERFLMGSTSSKIVNYAKNVDVLVVEPKED